MTLPSPYFTIKMYVYTLLYKLRKARAIKFRKTQVKVNLNVN